MESRGEARSGGETAGRDAWFWATIALSAITGLSATLVAARVTWSFGNRHFDLPDFVDTAWESGSYLVTAREFTVAYVAVPLVWMGMSLWWWVRRSKLQSLVQRLVFTAFAVVAMVGMATWFVTATEQATWAFHLDGVPDLISTVGIRPADLREPVVAVGLTFLIIAAASNLTAMLLSTARRPASTNAEQPTPRT